MPSVQENAAAAHLAAADALAQASTASAVSGHHANHEVASRRGFYRYIEAFYMACLRFSMRQRWLILAVGSFLGIASAETLAAHVPLFIIPAAGFGIGCSISVAVAAWSTAAYLLLETQAAARR